MRKTKNAHPGLRTDRNQLIRFFIIFSSVSVFLSMELAMLTRGNAIRDSLFWNGYYSDHFMDFYNTLRDSRDLTWVYQRNVIYPPLSVLFMYFMTKFLPPELASILFADRLTLQSSQAAVMLYFFFAVICLLLFSVIVEKYMRDSGIDAQRFAVLFFCVISFPFVYCIERGNTSLLAVVGAAFFLFFRNDKSKYVRETAYIALAVAAGLKLFPAVLGVLLIYDRQFKPAARTVFYGVVLLAAPYLAIQLLTPKDGGLGAQMASQAVILNRDGTVGSMDGSFMRLVRNLFRWINKRSFFSYNSTGLANLVYLAKNMGAFSAGTARTLATVLFIASETVTFALGFFCKKEWQKQFIAVYLMLNIHTIAMHYTLIYLVPVFVVFLCTEGRKRTNVFSWIYFSFFAVEIVPLPYLLYGVRTQVSAFLETTLNLPAVSNFNKFFSGVAFQMLALFVAAEIVSAAIYRRRSAAVEKRNARI